MRAICLAETPDGKQRPVVILTREVMYPYLDNTTVAPITSTVRSPRTEVQVGPENGIDHESVISCDNIQTIPRSHIGRKLGELTLEQEAQLTETIHAAFRLL